MQKLVTCWLQYVKPKQMQNMQLLDGVLCQLVDSKRMQVIVSYCDSVLTVDFVLTVTSCRELARSVTSTVWLKTLCRSVNENASLWCQ